MKNMFKKLTPILLIILVAVAFAGCGSPEPKTLEDYISENPDARAQVENAVKVQSTDDMDVSINYEGNKAVISCQTKATYEKDMIDAIKKAYDSQKENLETSVEKAIKEIEESTGISDVMVDVIIKNGDGSEIWKSSYPIKE